MTIADVTAPSAVPVYTPQVWHDAPASDTPVSAARLAHMEQGIVDVAAALGVIAPPAGTPSGYVRMTGTNGAVSWVLLPTGGSGGGTTQIQNDPGTTGSNDDGGFAFEVWRDPSDPATKVGTIGYMTLSRGLYGMPVQLQPGQVTPAMTTWADVAPDSTSAWMVAFSGSPAPSIDVRKDGTVRVNSQEPLLTMGDSMFGIATNDLLQELSTQAGGWPVVRGATSGDLPDMISARMGITPAQVKVLNRRAASSDGKRLADDTLNQGYIPAGVAGQPMPEVQVRLSVALTSRTGAYTVEIGGVKGTLTIVETVAAADPKDPGSIAAIYDVGWFRRRDPGPGVIVADGEPLQIDLGRRWRHMGLIMPAPHHTFADRYMVLTVPLSATGTFTLTDSLSGLTTAAIAIPQPATGTGDDAQARRDADVQLARNVLLATAGEVSSSTAATFPSCSGLYMAQGNQSRGNLHYDRSRVVTIKFDPADVARQWTVGTGNASIGALGSGLDDTLDVVAGIIAGLTDEAKLRSLFLDTGCVSSEGYGTPRRALLDALFAGIRALAGPMWCGAVRQTQDEVLIAAAGLSVTDADRTQIANGCSPDTLATRDDGTVDPVGHFGPNAFRKVMWPLLVMHLRARGIIR